MKSAQRAVPDGQFLDEVFDRATDLLTAGVEPLAADLARGRPESLEDVREMIALARQVSVIGGVGMPDVPGYELLAEVGRGGMGVVYLAHQEAVGARTVALKVLPAGASLSTSARERFQAEAMALARLQHPGVVAVHDVVRSGDLFAYAMEWVEGATLAQVISRLKQRASPPDVGAVEHILGAGPGTLGDSSYPVFVARLGLEVARALDAVHNEGILHRDVKPSNLILRADGSPTLTDFGLARMDESEFETRSGAFLGTPVYSAPEQLRGTSRMLDQRTDIYSLGVTLFHALMLDLPVRGRSAVEVLEEVESGEAARLCCVAPSLPRDLATIVDKAMDPDPERRYDSAAELVLDFERLLRLEPIHARPPGRLERALLALRRNRESVVAGVAGGVLALGVALATAIYTLWLPRKTEEHLEAARLALLNPLHAELLYLALNPGADNHFSWSRVRAEARERGLEALDQYDAALAFAFGRDVLDMRLERAAVAAAVGLLDDVPEVAHGDELLTTELPLTAAAVGAWGRREGDAEIPRWDGSPEMERDLRQLGLIAFLCGRVDSCHAAWEQLDTVRSPDGLVDAALGQLYLREGRPAIALHHLRAAFGEFDGLGFLCIDLGRAALEVGDLSFAHERIREARGLETEDPWDSLVLLEADLAAAEGRDTEARELYEWMAGHHIDPTVRLAYGEFLVQRGEFGRAVRAYHELVRFKPWVPEYRRLYLQTLAAWGHEQGLPGLVRWVSRKAEPRVSLDQVLARALLASVLEAPGCPSLRVPVPILVGAEPPERDARFHLSR